MMVIIIIICRTKINLHSTDIPLPKVPIAFVAKLDWQKAYTFGKSYGRLDNEELMQWSVWPRKKHRYTPLAIR